MGLNVRNSIFGEEVQDVNFTLKYLLFDRLLPVD